VDDIAEALNIRHGSTYSTWSKKKKILIQWRSPWRGAKLVKDAYKLFNGTKKLVKRWNQCVEVEEDYLEKLY
jgi:hypothetical protein